MSDGATNSDQESVANMAQKKYKGVRRRKWGKWVSEIRVPGTQDRLWLGSYSSPEAAAVAHDVASYCLRGPSALQGLNFPSMLPSSAGADMSPKSIQKAASDVGMAIDAQTILNKSLEKDEKADEIGAIHHDLPQAELWNDVDRHNCGNWKGNESTEGESLTVSVEDYLQPIMLT